MESKKCITLSNGMLKGKVHSTFVARYTFMSTHYRNTLAKCGEESESLLPYSLSVTLFRNALHNAISLLYLMIYSSISV